MTVEQKRVVVGFIKHSNLVRHLAGSGWLPATSTTLFVVVAKKRKALCNLEAFGARKMKKSSAVTYGGVKRNLDLDLDLDLDLYFSKLSMPCFSYDILFVTFQLRSDNF